MRLTIEPTGLYTDVGGAACQLWRGTDQEGGKVEVFVRCVGSGDPACQARLAKVLNELPDPAAEMLAELDALLGSLGGTRDN